jgi:ubiquitin-conjugating enzyme E2 H
MLSHALSSTYSPHPPEYVQRYATKEAADAATDNNEEEEEEEEETMSEVGSISDGE